MIYTIVETKAIHEKQSVNFDKKGNKYLVGFTGKAEGEYTYKIFDTMDEALSVYQKFVEAFITGCFSYEDRKKWLD